MSRFQQGIQRDLLLFPALFRQQQGVVRHTSHAHIKGRQGHMIAADDNFSVFRIHPLSRARLKRQSGPEILINRFFQINAAPADTEPVLHRTQSDGMPVTNGKLAAVRCGPAEKFPAAAVAQHQALHVLRLHTGKKMRRNPQHACHTDQHNQQKSNGIAPHHHKSRIN